MRVLHFFKTYYPDSFGGIEQVIYQLAEGGRRLGIEAEVLSLSPRGVFRNEVVAKHLTHGAPLNLYIASTGFSWSVFSDFKELAAKADIVHYHFPWPFMDLVHFATRVNKPSVLSYHSDIVKQRSLLKLYQPLMNRFIRSMDSVVVASPNYVNSSPFLSNLGEKVTVIPYGLERDACKKSDLGRLHKWRSLLGERFFLFVGALRYYKGLHFLLDAMKGVDYPLVIIGAGCIEQRLKDQACQLGLNNIHFLGALSDEDKFAILELCYSFVFPSHLRSEAFGISLLEAAMYGKPMISCEIGTGTSYINIHGETGLVVQPENSDDLRQAMMFLWGNPDQAYIYGDNAARRYQYFFTAEKMTEQYASVYRKCFESRL